MLLVLPRALESVQQQQLELLADSGRFSTREELLATSLSRSASIEIREFESRGGQLRLVVWMPSISEETSCELTMYADGREAVQRCVNLPDKGKEERFEAMLYFVLVLLATGVRVALAGRTHPPIGVPALGRMTLPFLLHPFWLTVPNPSWCDETQASAYLWWGFAGVLLIRNAFFGSYEPPRPPRPERPPPPRGPDGRRQFR